MFKFAQKGFTLIETLVAISIFSIVMVLGVGAILSVSSANERTQAIRSLSDNLNFAMEDISRNIRTGREIVGTSSQLELLNQDGDMISYELDNNRIFKTIEGNRAPITSSEIQVTRFDLAVVEEPQTRVFLFLQGRARVGGQTTEFDLQTSASQRSF